MKKPKIVNVHERVLGLDRDTMVIASDFDAPLSEDLLAEFER